MRKNTKGEDEKEKTCINRILTLEANRQQVT